MFHWRLQGFQLFFSHIVDDWTQKCQTWIRYSITNLFHWSSFQSLWDLTYLSLFTLLPFQKRGFVGCYPSTKTIPDQASVMSRRPWTLHVVVNSLHFQVECCPVFQSLFSPQISILWFKFCTAFPILLLSPEWCSGFSVCTPFSR